MSLSKLSYHPRSSLAAGALLFLAACGPTVSLKPEFAQVKPRLVALLPVKADPEVRAERVAYLEQSLEAGIASRGFALIDRETVRRMCRDAECSGKKELIAKYPVQGLFQFQLESISRNSFGIGYYNTITGKLTLADTNGKELLTIDHTEREKGGVLFESGQVIQGIISQVRNAGDDAYNRLADRFARTLALRIPQPEVSVVADVERAEVGQVTVQNIQPDVFEICAEAAQSSTTSLLINKVRTTLRPVAPGRYCGIFRFDEGTTPFGPIIVEARSAFGDATRREVPLRLEPMCDLNGKIHVASAGKGFALRIDCSPVKGGGKGASSLFECTGFMPAQAENDGAGSVARTAPSCSAAKFLVYRSEAEIGPYQKVAEVRGTSWLDSMKQTTGTPTYHIIAVRPDGGFSTPVRAGGETSSVTAAESAPPVAPTSTVQ